MMEFISMAKTDLKRASKNKLGLIGCILALVPYIFISIPFLAQTCGLLGIFFSVFALQQRPRTFAIIGLSLSIFTVFKLVYFIVFLHNVLH